MVLGGNMVGLGKAGWFWVNEETFFFEKKKIKKLVI